MAVGAVNGTEGPIGVHWIVVRRDGRRTAIEMPRDIARHLQPAGPGAIGSVPHPNIGRTQEVPLMDVQPLAISIGFPGQRKTRPKPASPARAAPSDPGGGAAASIANRRPWLLAYTTLSIIAGLTALAWTTLRVPISPTIDPALNGTALAGPSGGMLLWIAYGMIGSLRDPARPRRSLRVDVPLPVRRRGDGPGRPDRGRVGRFRFHDRTSRDREVPWYGTLANHSVMAFAAVVGGLTAQVVNGALLTTSVSAGVAGLVAVTGGTLVLAAVLILGTAGTIMLREGLSAGSLGRDR